MTLKILIVDDGEDKIKRLMAVFDNCNIDSKDIDLCQTSHEARQKLRDNKYDLLLIDIALPLHIGDSPDSKEGMSLLDELSDRDIYKKPSYIVGITAYEELYNQLKNKFSERLWSLLHADFKSDSWLKRVEKLIIYILKVKTSGNQYSVDICIITAMQTPELDAILDLPWEWEEPDFLDTCTFYHRGVLKLDHNTYNVIAVTTGLPGMVTSAILASKLINMLHPRFLIMTGICAGVKEHCKLGDVLFACEAWDWQSGKYTVEGGISKFLIEPHQIQVPSYVTTRMMELKTKDSLFAGILNNWSGEKPNTPIRLRIGPLASGSSVLANPDRVEQVMEQHRKLVGIDMEIYGVYASAFYGPHPRPTFFALKGVSDYGTTEKSDKWQTYASYVSAQTLKIFVERYLKDLLPLAGTL